VQNGTGKRAAPNLAAVNVDSDKSNERNGSALTRGAEARPSLREAGMTVA
jgi:hypothetical protein